ncbi:dihydrofolate reductase family protein [Leifsonia sp. Leaf336]|uniref:dihydrofolate reductase family protein n=1 Tax=Leifsonia sp. Leaf336 TaxID=1736341 RepID=UPI001F1D032E|nr:dihydrofolate reductase family protein [Leifsonia sp. Leaf336]
MSVSLDGYVTGPNDSRQNPFGDGAQDLHAWLRPTASDDDRAVLEGTIGSVGAIVMGRRSFEKNEGDGGWGDAGPMGDVPVYVLTHNPPARAYPKVFTFVSEGVADAVQDARRAAGDKNVHLFGATVMQQALPLGLVDELHLHVMPVLLGGGTPLFGSLDSAIALERVGAVPTPFATHLRYRVLR